MSGRSMIVSACAALVLLLAAILQGAGNPDRMSGFSVRSESAKRAVAEKFKQIPSPEEARKWHRYSTAEPHPAGSERNNQLARYIADRWQEQGWENVIIHRYDVRVSDPREILVEMVHPVRFRAGMREEAYNVDPDTDNPNVRSGYLRLSASGEGAGCQSADHGDRSQLAPPDGIPGRPWFKHFLYAARYTYAHLELPGLTEAVEKRDWKTVREQANILENALATNSSLLREAAEALRRVR